MKHDRLMDLIEELGKEADAVLDDQDGKAGVFDRNGHRYYLASLAASYILGGKDKAFAHPDKPGEPLVQFLMPWRQYGLTANLYPVFVTPQGLRLLGGVRGKDMPRPGLYNLVGGGFKAPEDGLQRTEVGRLEWTQETNGQLPLEGVPLTILDDVSLTGQYGGMFPERDTNSLLLSCALNLRDPDKLLRTLRPNAEFSSFSLVGLADMDGAKPVDGIGWAFPYGDPDLGWKVLEWYATNHTVLQHLPVDHMLNG